MTSSANQAHLYSVPTSGPSRSIRQHHIFSRAADVAKVLAVAAAVASFLGLLSVMLSLVVATAFGDISHHSRATTWILHALRMALAVGGAVVIQTILTRTAGTRGPQAGDNSRESSADLHIV
jgi:Na+/phosphate symporter